MRWLVILALCASALACNQPVSDKRAVYVLLDRSGTYGQDFEKVTSTLKQLLANMEPGDALTLARADNENASAQDIVMTVTFSSRPSQANSEKRAVLKAVEQLAVETRVGSYTDITGGLLQAMSWLNATGAGKKLIIVLSDFPDEPREGYMREFPVNFNGARVMVWNAGQAEPVAAVALTASQSFAERAALWQQRVESGGGSWQLVNDVAEINSWFR